MAANVLKAISRWHLVERNVHIDIKTKFVTNTEHRLKKVDEKRSIMMTKKWTTPERESIADSAITCLEQHGY